MTWEADLTKYWASRATREELYALLTSLDERDERARDAIASRQRVRVAVQEEVDRR